MASPLLKQQTSIDRTHLLIATFRLTLIYIVSSPEPCCNYVTIPHHQGSSNLSNPPFNNIASNNNHNFNPSSSHHEVNTITQASPPNSPPCNHTYMQQLPKPLNTIDVTNFVRPGPHRCSSWTSEQYLSHPQDQIGFLLYRAARNMMQVRHSQIMLAYGIQPLSST